MLEAVKTDKEARRVFLAMSREDQLLAILGMIAFNNSQLAQIAKIQIDQGTGLENFKNELRNVRIQREALEGQLAEKLNIKIATPVDNTMDTTTKVKAVIAAQYGGFIKFFIDIFKSILTTVLTIIILAILYLSFGGPIPGR